MRPPMDPTRGQFLQNGGRAQVNGRQVPALRCAQVFSCPRATTSRIPKRRTHARLGFRPRLLEGIDATITAASQPLPAELSSLPDLISSTLGTIGLLPTMIHPLNVRLFVHDRRGLPGRRIQLYRPGLLTTLHVLKPPLKNLIRPSKGRLDSSNRAQTPTR
ncbi:hypothetical protein LX36DRAFT_182127 [Colletotrichum falcatum]|nr:hypothetical protein LX36DRAFT_182127 [Colletotrichum falcatum]